jgi:hypothetical protein
MGTRLRGACLVLLAIQLGISSPARAQQAVPTPGPYTTYPSLDIDIAGNNLTLTLTRAVLGSGQHISIGGKHSPLLVLVEQGELSADSTDVRRLEPQKESGSTESQPLLWVAADTSGTLTAGNEQTAITLLSLGATLERSAFPDDADLTQVVSETLPLSGRVRLDLQRLQLAQWSTTDEWSMVDGRALIVEDGALYLKVEDGRAQIGREYGSQETMTAADTSGTPGAEPDPQADPEAEEEEGSSPVATPPVPVLNGTVASLLAGDSAIVSGDGELALQGASDSDTTLLLISFNAASGN